MTMSRGESAGPRRRPLMLALFLSAAVAWSLPGGGPTATAQGEGAQVCQANRSLTLFAERIGKRKIGYGTARGEASVPGPTITMQEGDCLAVTLVNETDRRVGLHPHGIDYTVNSDGTPLNSSCVAPGGSRTYVWQAHEAGTRPDGTIESSSAGYWHYHDHCMGGPHGTAGVYSGLFGALVVRKAEDPVPDRPPFVVVMGPGSTIGLKRAPHTPLFEANQGERVEFVVIGHGDEFHTFHLHGHRWVDNRTGLASSVDDPTTVIDNKTLGPADSFGFQVIAGERVGPGAWMYHCHVQGHSDAGMAGLFLVRTPEGTITPEGQRALDRWERQHDDH